MSADVDPVPAALLAALRAALVRAPGRTPGPEVRARARALDLLPILAGAARPDPDEDAAGRDELATARLEALAGAARARAELGEALAALEGAGVAALALKGPALAARTGLVRPGGDLDLLLVSGAGDLPRAERALAPLGLLPAPGSPPACSLVAERVLIAPGRLAVDLHLALMKPLLRGRCPRPGPGDVERLPIGAGQVAPTLDAAWTLAFAAVQLHQDGLSLRRLVDLAALLSRLDARAVADSHDVARRFGLAGILGWGASLAHEWLGAPRPLVSARPPTLLQRALFPRLSRPAQWAAPAPTWLDGRAPEDDATELRRTLLRLALLDDAPRVVPDRLLRLAFPPAEYARWRGQGPWRAPSLVLRALAAVLRRPRPVE